MSDSNTEFFKKMTDGLGKKLAAKDQAQREKKAQNTELIRIFQKTAVATLAERTEKGEATATFTNKAIDVFLKPGEETQGGLFHGCRTNLERFDRSAVVVSMALSAIAKILPPPEPTLSELALDIVKSTGCLFVEIGKSTKGFVEDHPLVTTVVAGVATGGLAFAGAGTIAAGIGSVGGLGAASTGVPISSLSGAALKSASLAKLGGGALAAGGTGMAGGTATVTGTGTALGSISTYKA